MPVDRTTRAASAKTSWHWDGAHRELYIAVVGATGAVGRELIGVLLAHGHTPDRIECYARRAQMLGLSHGPELRVQPMGDAEAFAAQSESSKTQIAFLCTPSEVSLGLAPALADRGVTVIDLSSAHRMRNDVPLVIPEINAHEISHARGMFANPNCTAAVAALPLAVLERAAGLLEVIVVSFQAASGAGVAGLDTLHAELREAASDRSGSPADGERAQRSSARAGAPSPFAAVLALNVIPAVAEVDENGTSGEEHKVRNELRRILGRPDLTVEVTTTRVPVERCHSVAVHVKLARPLAAHDARALMASAPGIEVSDDPHGPRPRECAGTDPVHVGRIRSGTRGAGSLCFFAVGDQLRKGAALNAVQIAAALPARMFRTAVRARDA